jgi:hypothetical protein
MYNDINKYTDNNCMEDTKRREIIIRFINENQPCTSQALVKGVSDKISRVPVFDTLSELMEDGIVKDQKINRRDHRLFIDTKNPMIVVSREIDEFESVYISLLKNVKEHINKRYHDLKTHHYSNPQARSLGEIDEFFHTTDSISRSLRIFSDVLMMYMLRSAALWPNMIRDRDFVNKLNSTIFTKFSDMWISMNDILSPIKTPRGQFSLDDIGRDTMFDTAKEIIYTIREFDDLDIKKEAEQVSTFIYRFIRDEMIRRADYGRTSKYKWDMSQIQPELIKKTEERMSEILED